MVKIELNLNEGIILFELLSRINKSESKISFEDQAEQRVLWNLESELEKQLAESFKKNYSEILSNA